MVTKEQFEEAKETILEYEFQQRDKLPFVEGTLNTPSRWYPARRWKEDGRVEVLFANPLNPLSPQERAWVRKGDEKYFEPRR